MAKQQTNFIPFPTNTGGPSVQTLDGFPEGMNVALPPHELDDTAARYLQDILLDQPGYIRRRGPLINSAENFPDLPFKASGAAFCLDPQGNPRLAALNGDTTHGQISFLNAQFSAINGSFAWNGFLPTAPPANPYTLVDIKAALTDGMWIGTSSRYDAHSPTQSLALWRGGISPDYSTGTITTTRGSAIITGSGTLWNANATPGMFVFGTTDDGYTLTYVGVVLSVVDDTHLLLGSVSPYPITAKAYKLSSIRGFEPRIVTGRLTTTTASAIATGANTKFTTQLLAAGSYNAYRANDMTWIGKVLSITNDTSLTLAANAAVALNNEPYVILRGNGDWSINTAATPSKVGFLNAVYAERQWYGNLGQSFATTNRVYFSEATDPEDVDLSSFDGNFLDIASTTGVNSPITGMCPAYNALLVFKENETFGVYGNTTSTFNVQKIEDDGCLAAGSIQPYGGGVLWAGRTGIFFYDGVQTTNIVAGNLGTWYKDLVRVIDPSKYRMWSTMSRDHYFLFLELANPTVPIVKGTVSTTSSYLTIVINMISKAPTVFTNFAIRGGLQMPASLGLETLFLVNTSTVGKFFSSTHVFNDSGNDTITCDVASGPGPDFYIETKKYNADDSMLLKLWSQLLMNYQCSGAAMNVDTVIGLNDVGSTTTTQLTPTIYTWDTLKAQFATWNTLKATNPTWASLIKAVFKPKRLRFLKRSQNFAFRVWQSNSSVNHVVIGPFQLGFKKMRPGRI